MEVQHYMLQMVNINNLKQNDMQIPNPSISVKISFSNTTRIVFSKNKLRKYHNKAVYDKAEINFIRAYFKVYMGVQSFVYSQEISYKEALNILS